MTDTFVLDKRVMVEGFACTRHIKLVYSIYLQVSQSPIHCGFCIEEQSPSIESGTSIVCIDTYSIPRASTDADTVSPPGR